MNLAEKTKEELIEEIEKLKSESKSSFQGAENYKNLIEHSPDGVFIHDDKGWVVFANPSALKMIGLKSLEEIENRSVFQYIFPEYHGLIKNQKEKIERGEASPFFSVKVKRPDGTIIEVELKSMPFVYEGKKSTLAVTHDITFQRKLEKEQLRAQIAEETNKILQEEIAERKKIEDELRESEEKITESLKEKEILLKEVHHRVKNNLQVISSILNLQSSYTKDSNTINILRESQNRIKTMSFIHESLYQTKDFAGINFSEYVENLAKNILYSFVGHESNIKLNLDIEKVFLNLDPAISCGLIINELLSNSLKHAFPGNKKGEITIALYADSGQIKLVVSDNGIGIPREIDFKNTESLGLQLVIILVQQLGGKIELEKRPQTKFTIMFNNKSVK